jgi:hypothetical protein
MYFSGFHTHMIDYGSIHMPFLLELKTDVFIGRVGRGVEWR